MSSELLCDEAQATRFYDHRYDHGYMQDWPEQQKERVRELIARVDLVAVGSAIDFGCGNGVFTELLRQALPLGWSVCGLDISERAINNARRRYPDLQFYVGGAEALGGRHFDLLFTHHVLEHVSDLSEALADIDRLLAPTATMVHVLPCGNDGSFEHSVCLLRMDGIDPSLGNRFFYEDVGHLRRLTPAQLGDRIAAHGFKLVDALYRCQHHAAIEWITRSGPDFIRGFTDTANAASPRAAFKLLTLRVRLMAIWRLRQPTFDMRQRMAKKPKSRRNRIGTLVRYPLYLLSRGLDARVERRAEREWALHKDDPRASEMYLSFRRDDPGKRA